MEGQVKTHAPHDCTDWRTEIWHNQKELTYKSCDICGHVTKFTYKKWRDRIKAVFHSATK